MALRGVQEPRQGGAGDLVDARELLACGLVCGALDNARRASIRLVRRAPSAGGSVAGTLHSPSSSRAFIFSTHTMKAHQPDLSTLDVAVELMGRVDKELESFIL